MSAQAPDAADAAAAALALSPNGAATAPDAHSGAAHAPVAWVATPTPGQAPLPGLEPPSAPQAAQPAAPDLPALARLYGEPLFELPTDLYIPPDALKVILEAFQGPLDLLLYLIRKQNFNILDIPMVEITRQYLGYVEDIRAHNLELAAEYLLMAAMLIEIKSRMLLPARASQDGKEPEDPRAELVRRLLEYEQMKLAAQQLDALPQLGRDLQPARVTIDQTLVLHLPEVSVDDLRSAWRDILRRAKLHQHHRITREQLSVRDFMGQVLRRLQPVRFLEFGQLFEVTRGPTVMVVTFIALLELAREQLVELTQAEAYAPIYVRLAYTPVVPTATLH